MLRCSGRSLPLLVLSGTMGNLVSVMTQARPGTEPIVEQEAHIFKNEGGGMARVAGVMPRRIPGVKGALDPGLVESQIGTPSVLNHGVSLICVEQTHNGASGTAIPLENIAALRKIADRAGAKVHMDGARVFNAATTLGVPVSKVVENVDSVTFCLSKGLCCPLGAVVAGSKDFIEEARFNRPIGGYEAGWVMPQPASMPRSHGGRACRVTGMPNANTILAECGFEVDLIQFRATSFGSRRHLSPVLNSGIV